MAGAILGAVGQAGLGLAGDYAKFEMEKAASRSAAKRAFLDSIFAYQHRYQWAAQDMKLAGLNPILALPNVGGAPSAPMARTPEGPDFGGTVERAVTTGKRIWESRAIAAQIRNMEVDNAIKEQQWRTEKARADKSSLESQIYQTWGWDQALNQYYQGLAEARKSELDVDFAQQMFPARKGLAEADVQARRLEVLARQLGIPARELEEAFSRSGYGQFMYGVERTFDSAGGILNTLGRGVGGLLRGGEMSPEEEEIYESRTRAPGGGTVRHQLKTRRPRRRR